MKRAARARDKYIIMKRRVALVGDAFGDLNLSGVGRGRHFGGKAHRFVFETGVSASSWANAIEDAKDFVPAEGGGEEEEEEEGGALFADDIFHQPADDEGEGEEAVTEEGFDETVTKKQAFHFWGVDK